VHQPVPNGDIHLVIVGPALTFPYFVFTAYKAGTESPNHEPNPNPTVAEQWFDVADLVCAIGQSQQYGLHLYRDIKGLPTKPYRIEGTIRVRDLPPIP